MSEQMPENGDLGGGGERSGRKEQDQVQLILEEFRDEVEIDPPDWREAGTRQIYRRGSFLIRDRDVNRILRIFPEGEIVDGGIDGLTRFRPYKEGSPGAGDPTLSYIAIVDQVLGVGVAHPDRLIWVSSVSPCPATEPIEVPPGIPPDPAPVSGDCDGRGVKVLVVDVGWSKSDAYWLAGVDGDEEVAYEPPNSTDIKPYAGHGTFIAGVIRCVAPRTEIVVKGYLNRAGAAFGSDLVVKLEEALAENPDLISLSAGTKAGDSTQLLALDVFLEHLSRLKGVIVVAAAGNDGKREFFFPAASPQTVSVGALAEDRRHRADFSNYGGWVDVYAPGEDIVNAYLTGTYTCTESPHLGERREFAGMARWSGTSFATPLVAGLIAGRMSATGENARQAADALLAYGLEHAIPGVGRVLLPGDACASLEHRGCEPCRPQGCHHC